MAYKISFNSPKADSTDDKDGLSKPGFDHEAHMAKMESGIQEALTMLESGEPERAIPVLKGLLQEEETEEEAEGMQESPEAEAAEQKPDMRSKLMAMMSKK